MKNVRIINSKFFLPRDQIRCVRITFQFYENILKGDHEMDERDFDVIHTYTRKQAIEDGVLIDVTEQAKETGFKVPVAVTSTLYHRYIEPPEELEGEGQSIEGRMHDVLLMVIKAAKDRWEGSMVEFEILFLMNQNPNIEFEKVTCWAMTSAGDSLEPVLTVMLPEDY